MFKRVFCLFLVLTMLVPTIVSVSANSLPFTDVPESHAYYDAINYLYHNGVMNGISSTEFGCTLSVNRAMFVTILYRLSGCDDIFEPDGFTDVPEDSFYYYAVGWGQYYGIVNGINDTTFGPSMMLTRQQLFTFLYRYADSYEYMYHDLPDPDIIEQFYDYSSIEPFAYDASNWAVNSGIYPSSQAYFLPESTVPRALCAQYLYKFLTLTYGDAKALVSQEFVDCWHGDTICTLLNDAGYEAYAQSFLNPIATKFALFNNDVVYISCHGMDEYICLQGGYLYYTDFERNSLIGLDLAYISACYAGGTFATHLSDYALANYVVGFTEQLAVEPSYVDWGANKFDRLFFVFFTDPVEGGDVQHAIDLALAEFSEYEQEQYGIISVKCRH